MPHQLMVVTFGVDERGRALVTDTLGGAADVTYLVDVHNPARAQVLQTADALLVRNIARELGPEERPLLGRARLIQFMSAGVDFISFGDLPASVPMAANGGAYAESMAEHALAMTLAAAKRLLIEHRNLSVGQFNQFAENRMLAGGVCGIFGFGGVGIAVARLMRCVDMRIHAINRHGTTEAAVDWIGSPNGLDQLLAASDVLVIGAPLTRSTKRIIGARELSLMKSDAILVNLARGEIVDEAALFAHLRSSPRFTACLDAWWVEPVRHGEFRIDHAFLDLPNVIGSPHNSASSGGAREIALRRAVANCRRVLTGELPLHLITSDERMR